MTNIREKEANLITSQISVSVLSIYNFINCKVITSILRKDNIVHCYCTALIMISITTQVPNYSRAAKPWLLTFLRFLKKRYWMKKICPKEMATWKCAFSINQISMDQSHSFLFVLTFLSSKSLAPQGRN